MRAWRIHDEPLCMDGISVVQELGDKKAGVDQWHHIADRVRRSSGKLFAGGCKAARFASEDRPSDDRRAQ